MQGVGVDEEEVQVPDRILKQAMRRRKETTLLLDCFRLKTAALHFGVKSVEDLESKSNSNWALKA